MKSFLFSGLFVVLLAILWIVTGWPLLFFSWIVTVFILWSGVIAITKMVSVRGVTFSDVADSSAPIMMPVFFVLTFFMMCLGHATVNAFDYSVPAEELSKWELAIRLTDLQVKKEETKEQEVEKKEDSSTLNTLEQVKELEKELEFN